MFVSCATELLRLLNQSLFKFKREIMRVLENALKLQQSMSMSLEAHLYMAGRFGNGQEY